MTHTGRLRDELDRSATLTSGLSEEARALLGRRARTDEDAVATSNFGHRSPSAKSAPLSPWQESIWFFDQMEPGRGLYNCAYRLRLRGLVDVRALEKSVGEIFRRHDILRSRVRMEDGHPVQCLVSDYAFSLAISDISMVALRDHGARYAAVADAEAAAPFDLAVGPFARAALIRLDAEENVLLFTAHHIAFDGWSAGLFFRELGELYSAFAAGQLSPLSESEFQYADFAAWECARIESTSIDDDVTYWMAQMAGAPSLLELPADRSRAAARSHVAGRASILIPSDLADRLGALGRGEGATLFMTMLAAFQLLVSRLSGKDDVVVGIPVAGRTKVETETMLGCFINLLPLRTHFVGDVTFRELLTRVRRTALGAFAHQELPFDVLVERLQPERSLGHTPVTQVLFNFRNTPASSLLFRGLDAVIEPAPFSSVISDFELGMEQGPYGLSCTALYSAELFDASTVERWLGHFQTLLEGIVASPDGQVSRLPLLSASERRLILVDWNAAVTPPDYESCLHQLVEAQVRRTPNAIAVIASEGSLTYGELNGRANRMARDLAARGVGPDVLVGICMERCPELIVALLAVLKAGGAYLPLDPDYPVDRLAFMLADSHASVLITQRGVADRLATESAQTIYIDAAYWNDAVVDDEIDDDIDVKSPVTPGDLAYVVYTSGSTGRPKGAMNAHRAVCNLVLRSRDRHGIVATDIVLHRTPLSFDPSVWEIFTSLTSGARLVLARPHGHADPAYLAGLIEEHGITVIDVVPSVLQVLLDVPELSRLCRSLRIVACGGEALSTTLHERFFATLTTTLHNVYGPTEAAVNACVWECERQTTRHAVPIGRPLGNVQTYILDAEREPVPIGVTGELYIGGIGVGRGYLYRPELTDERFIPDAFSRASGARLYRSGDLARFGPDGVIEFLGRADNQLKLRGVRIELGEIEAALATAGGVRECVVLAREDQPDDVRLVAYVVPQLGAALSDRVLREHLRGTLLPQMIPSTFVTLDSLPLTPNGKVDRRALPAPDAHVKSTVGARVQARTPTQVMVASVWADVLKTDQIGMEDNFFELGGHSLHAMQVMARIRDRIGIDIPLKRLFECPTVESLARMIEDITVSCHDDEELVRILAEVEATSAPGDDQTV